MATTSEWRATLHLPGGRLECTIRRSTRARNLRLVVDPRHTALVTVPARAARNRGEAERVALQFVAERETWLRRHLAAQARQGERVAALGPLDDGGYLPFRGEPHRIRVEDMEAGARRLGAPASRGRAGAVGRSRTVVNRVGADEGDEIVVRLGRDERRDLPAILEAWLRVRARDAVEREVARHASTMGVAPAALTVRDAKTRWGSCSRASRLSFSWRLIMAPPEALETVVIHELAHLRVFGHGPDFWEIVASRRPDHRRWRKWLRDHRIELHEALSER